MGPFSREEIQKKMTNKQILGFHECSDDDGRSWRPVDEWPDFASPRSESIAVSEVAEDPIHSKAISDPGEKNRSPQTFARIIVVTLVVLVVIGSITVSLLVQRKSSENSRSNPEMKKSIDANSRGQRGEKEQIKANIERVLQQDAKASEGSETVAKLVARMRAIDTSDCPNEFRLAYLAHIHSWEMMEDVQRDASRLKEEANSDGVLVEAFIRGLLGDPLGKANEIKAAQTQLQRSYQVAHTEIRKTFHHVEEIAIQYDANLPK